ncbi:MAG: hypothetical protein FWH18_08665 [Marinilabiliaceae bacterium]|nr:hypothetical protein [Marinilabiliaceae bacterium]
MYKKRLFKALILMLFAVSNMSAQKLEIADFLKAGKENANTLAEAYLSPFGEMMGRSVNGGWYSVASVHSILGIDINIGMNFAMVSSTGKEFNVNDCEMIDGWKFVDGYNMAPTIAGKMDENKRPRIAKDQGESIPLPNGMGLSMAPMPIFQAGLGLPARTDIIVRFCPQIKVADFRAGLWGIGLKHDIKEYLPIIKHLPVLHTSILLGYTKMNMNFEINKDNKQKLVTDVSGFTGRLLVGANIPFVAFYMGLGYGYAASAFDLEGTYNYGGQNFTDPISQKYTYNNFDANIGARLKFGVVTLHGDYTLGKYSMVTAGLGVAFR